MALRHSIGDLASTVLSMVRTRLELFSLEAVSEKTRLIRILCMAFGALLLLSLALLVFSIAVALYFWPTEERYLAIGVLALIYALAGLGLFWGVWHCLSNGPIPFSATLDELKRDISLAERLREPDEHSDSRGERHG
ncbi:phage holin family protein [Pusillimonas caeni]|uniref:phage holin family protein n=1 Tax=Pusillimonas caeni TaxID=1348472 RepID=UPI000E59B7B6|nr:phage holin family protein [Pusillimonas caeni]TFL13178.1 phage holin family protein [Pusillimonas caeni]